MPTISDELIKESVSSGRNERGHIIPEVVYELREAKVSVARIAKEFGVSRNAIYKILNERKDLLAQKHKADMMRLSPWSNVSEEHRKAAPRKYVAYHIEFVLTGGKEMADYKVESLRFFYNKLAGVNVLTYDPDRTESTLGMSGGWDIEPKIPSDGDLIVRTDEELTNEQKSILVLPDGWDKL